VPGSAVRPLSAQHKAYTRSAEEIWGQFSHNKITQAELEQGLAALEKSYRRARIIGRVGRVVMVVGLILTVKDVAEAAERSLAQVAWGDDE
jgi:ferric-dicitrate binding protein FerR (iron transport regulator)